MAAEGHVERRWLDGAALRRASDLALGVISAVLGAAAIAIAQTNGAPFGRWDRLDGWFFPATIGGLLLIVGIVLLLRASFPRPGERTPWSLLGLAIALAAIAAADFGAALWGYKVALWFGPSEIVALVIFELAVVIALARRSRTRAVAMALVGLLLATVGTDVSTGSQRMTMGLEWLADGIAFPVLVLGLTIVADGVLCLFSPSILLATYARQVAGWAGPRIGTVLGFGMRIVAVAAIAAACLHAFRLNAVVWEIGELLLFGVFGLACKMFGWNRLALILASYYGPLLEENIRRAMMLSQGDPASFLRRPISATLLLLAFAFLAVPALLSVRRALVRGAGA